MFHTLSTLAGSLFADEAYDAGYNAGQVLFWIAVGLVGFWIASKAAKK